MAIFFFSLKRHFACKIAVSVNLQCGKNIILQRFNLTIEAETNRGNITKFAAKKNSYNPWTPECFG